MNKQLKFSWGHIIAFLSLIFVGYVSFMGITYLTNGNFTKAKWGTAFIIIFLLLIFIGGQILKSTTKKFKSRIWLERFLILGSPIFFILLMIPYIHFWTIYNNEKAIVNVFTTAVNDSKKLFTDYEDYSNKRITDYNNMLNDIIRNKEFYHTKYLECDFNGKYDAIQKNNKVEALKIQMRSENYDSLKHLATTWIDKVSGASVWNVFILGNIKQTKNSVQNWHKTLVDFSEHKLIAEDKSVDVFDINSDTIKTVEDELDELNRLYTKQNKPSTLSLITVLICYFMMLFPYILQDRHTKSTYRLFGRKKEYNDDINKRSKENEIDNTDDNDDEGFKPIIL